MEWERSRSRSASARPRSPRARRASGTKTGAHRSLGVAVPMRPTMIAASSRSRLRQCLGRFPTVFVAQSPEGEQERHSGIAAPKRHDFQDRSGRPGPRNLDSPPEEARAVSASAARPDRSLQLRNLRPFRSSAILAMLFVKAKHGQMFFGAGKGLNAAVEFVQRKRPCVLYFFSDDIGNACGPDRSGGGGR